MEGASGMWEQVVSIIQANINVNTVSTVLAAALGIAAIFSFAWWGARKVLRMIMAAFRKGRVSV